MSGGDFVLFALQISVMICCALLCGALMRWFRQPPVLGEMAGGILLGPTVFGALAPEWQSALFPAAGNVALIRDAVVKLGMLFFLFIVGLELDFADIRVHGRRALCIGLFGSLVPLVAGVIMVFALPGWWGESPQTNRLALALFMGAALANTANPVLARILQDLGLLRLGFGAMLMTATLVDDVVGWSLLAVVLSDTSSTWHPAAGILLSALGVVAFFAIVLVAVRYLGRPLLHWAGRQLPWPTGLLGSAIVMILLAAAAAERLGLHAFLGPFLVGVALAPTKEEREAAYDAIASFTSSFFVPIYFVSLGLSHNFAAHFDLALVLVVFTVASVSKLAGVYGGARLGGLRPRTASAVGFGMNARGAIGLILAALGLEAGVIDERTYVALVVLALATSLLAGPMMKLLLPASAGDAEQTNEQTALNHSMLA